MFGKTGFSNRTENTFEIQEYDTVMDSNDYMMWCYQSF